MKANKAKTKKAKGKIWLMNIKDKIVISDEKLCPPHNIPHKLPLGDKITDEKCHYHIKKWRMAHHKPFCKVLKCPHYDFMIKRYKKYIENK